MDGPTLFDKLLAKRGLNPNSLAGAIKRPSAQSGFDRFKKGLIKQPKRSEALELAAKHLGVDVLAFYDEALAASEWARISGEAPPPATQSSSSPSVSGDEVVIVQYDVAGGMDTRGKLLLEAEPPGIIKSWKVDREWLQLNVRSYTSLANLCIVTGFGPSMKGMFNPGDPLLMDRGVNRVDHEGVYFFRVGDEGYIKILQRVPEFNGPGFVLRVISKNKDDFPPYDISPKNPHLHIIGKILTVWKSEQY
ncbi:S24 family peptidase [Variovorax sp. PMC12]|uniref:S24 family peptidase n=1 Tax=Variovorax sp. PMC12 TaxID=2126319 RepID=UPI0018FEB5BD|nr:helix-turn-helix transcriptional regulator [Variovorax sp. PMC12]